MSSNAWCYIGALCLLATVGAKAQNNNNSNDTETATVGDKFNKVEPANISALYIGDLLRTKPSKEEVMEASASVHRPTNLYHHHDRSFLSAAPAVPDYKTHGGHEYASVADAEYVRPATHTGGRARNAGATHARSSAGIPVNVMGHLLTVKPVTVVKTVNALPRSRDGAHHYEGDDCNSKSGERSTYSSEEKPYPGPEQQYRRAKQVAPEPEYRNPQPVGGYPDDDRSDTYSHSDPSSYDSKSYATDTKSYPSDSKSYATDTNSKSHSSGSYTKSKSTSSSKTVTPSSQRDKVHRIVPKPFSHAHHDRPSPYVTHSEDQDVVVYKVKKPSQRPTGYTEGSDEREYTPPSSSSYDREHGSKPREAPHSQYHHSPASPSKKSRKYNRQQYSTTSERPQQYGPVPTYEQEKDGYSSPYAGEHRYRESKPEPGNYREEEQYSPYKPEPKEQKPYYRSYKTPEGGALYDTEQPVSSKSPLRKKHRSPYERPSTEYRTTTEYSYPEHQIQSSRNKKEIPSYESYQSQDATQTEQSPTPQSYERTSLRPSEERQMNHQYVYEDTPHHPTADNHKRQYRESSGSSRPVRSPDRSVIVEGRAHLAGAENEPLILMSRGSKPYVSRSESYSESSYNMGQNRNPAAESDPYGNKRQLDAKDVESQTSYKPFNSEYPASYANDQHHQEQRSSHSYERSPRSHDSSSQSQTKSYSGDGPRQYDGGREPSYDHDEGDGSYEGEGGTGTGSGKSKGHHYISKIEGYKDSYGAHEPLVIDEAFFKKYGISPNAKVIIASAKDPNLFVADGTKVKEGEFFGLESGPSSGPSSGSSPDGPPSPSYGPPSSAEQDSYEQEGYRNDDSSSYNESPEELGPPREIPGSFDDLVDTNPKFLRHLPRLLGDDSFFKMDSTEDSFDGVEFPGEKRGYVVSQGPRELVQKHGDGVSRIIFNMPKGGEEDESRSAQESKQVAKRVEEAVTERIVAAASEAIANFIAKSDS